jgi:hypothetical protein
MFAAGCGFCVLGDDLDESPGEEGDGGEEEKVLPYRVEERIR